MNIVTQLETKLADQTWIDTQDAEFINTLTQVKNVIQNITGQLYSFLEYFDLYVAGVYSSPIFAADSALRDQENGNLSPTQTSAFAPTEGGS